MSTTAATTFTPAAAGAARCCGPGAGARRPARAHPPRRRQRGRASPGQLLGVHAHPAGAADPADRVRHRALRPRHRGADPAGSRPTPASRGTPCSRPPQMLRSWLHEPELLLARVELSLEGSRASRRSPRSPSAQLRAPGGHRRARDGPGGHEHCQTRATTLIAAVDGVLMHALREEPAGPGGVPARGPGAADGGARRARAAASGRPVLG